MKKIPKKSPKNLCMSKICRNFTSSFNFERLKNNFVMKNAVIFLKELANHNNKEWFAANKLRYKAIQENIHAFTEKLIAGIASFDPSIAGLSVKDCSYRIYRDTRFSKDKTPYKTHIGIFVCKGGKCSGNAGYYVHIEPKNNQSMLNQSMIATGLYHPEPLILRSIREDIMSNGENFLKTIKAAKNFDWDDDESEKLSRPPKGFPAESPYIEYIKQKNFSLVQAFDEKKLDDNAKFLDFCVNQFKQTKAFADHVNRAVDFARNE